MLKLDVIEIRQPETDAAVVAYMVAEGLEKRMPFRRVMKQTIEKVIAAREVEGVRIAISGRLGGAEMSRKEQLKKGRIPLQTFRADIDFAHEKAHLPTVSSASRCGFIAATSIKTSVHRSACRKPSRCVPHLPAGRANI